MRFILFGIASMATMLVTQAVHLPLSVQGISLPLNFRKSSGSPYKNPFKQESMMLLEDDQSGGLSLAQKDEIDTQSFSTGGTDTSSSIDDQNSLPPLS